MESEKREMGGDIACVAVAPVPEGRQRCRYLAVRGVALFLCGGLSWQGCIQAGGGAAGCGQTRISQDRGPANGCMFHKSHQPVQPELGPSHSKHQPHTHACAQPHPRAVLRAGGHV